MGAFVTLKNGDRIDLTEVERAELVDAIETRFGIVNDGILRDLKTGADLSDWSDDEEDWRDAPPSDLESPQDLHDAITAAGRAHEPERQLADVLHYLIRAIPTLDPLIALCERETGRRMRP